MQIFLSHSSKQKPLVREIRRQFPEYLGAWIDEQKLLFGEEIASSLSTVISSETDYVLLFVDEFAIVSTWVLREIAWALEAEKLQGRTILLPIILDDSALARLDNIEIQNRKCLHLKDFSETSVRALAQGITSELFALVCRDMHRLRSPKPKNDLARISDADAVLKQQAGLIQRATFPHREVNPIALDTLLGVYNSQAKVEVTRDELESILAHVIRLNLVPGLVYDGFDLYLTEEHARWKSTVSHEGKERIGRKVASLIRNGMSVMIDAGSTAEEVVKILCKKIENRALTRITVATTSIQLADMLSNCCVAMGFDDNFSAVQLFVPGGRVRPSTQAIVGNGWEDKSFGSWGFPPVFDVGIIGVNGIGLDGRLTTHENSELQNKKFIVSASRQRLVVGDCSKIGLALEECFATLSDENVQLVTDSEGDAPGLSKLIAAYPDRVLVA